MRGLGGALSPIAQQQALPPQFAAMLTPAQLQAMTAGKERNLPTPASPEELARLQGIYEQGQGAIAPSPGVTAGGMGISLEDAVRQGLVQPETSAQRAFAQYHGVDLTTQAAIGAQGQPAPGGPAPLAGGPQPPPSPAAPALHPGQIAEEMAASDVAAETAADPDSTGVGTILTGLGLGQLQAGATSPSAREGLGGLVTLIGGLMKTAGVGGMWGVGLGILGTLINVSGQGQAANMRSDRRQAILQGISNMAEIHSGKT